MAMDVDRLTARTIELQDQYIAALGDNPTNAQIRYALEKARSQAQIEEDTNHMEIVVTGVTVNTQTGEQYSEAQGEAS
jgi:hypothetical protein